MTALKTPAPDAPAEEWGALAVSIPGWQCRPDAPVIGSIAWAVFRVDPDHWAWEGWMLRLLGDTLTRVEDGGRSWVSVSARPDLEGCGITLGRACIATAAALGRWPGGEL